VTTTTPWWWKGLQPKAIWWATRMLNECGGLRVTSARRTVLQNLRAHGVKSSGHIVGWCVDFVGTRAAMTTAAAFARDAGARQVLIHDVGSGLHLHVDFRGMP